MRSDLLSHSETRVEGLRRGRFFSWIVYHPRIRMEKEKIHEIPLSRDQTKEYF